MVPKTLLDSDILSSLLKNHPKAVRRARAYRVAYPSLTFSAMTRFEVLRGLRASNAAKQLLVFNQFCSSAEVLNIDECVIDRAAGLYAHLHRKGQLIPDADLLIAATALEHQLVLATNNLSDFERIPGLMIDNWLS